MSFITKLTDGGWTKPALKEESHIRKYSTTGDILSFKRCRRQYGFFHVRGFRSASSTQMYFGTLVHDVLDKIHRVYKLTGALPDKEGIREVVDESHELLVRSGIRPYDPKQQKENAIKLLDRFLILVNEKFFNHVQQTEYPLERELKTDNNAPYVLHGIVDVLSGAICHDLDLPYSTDPGDIEIWDYKASKRPAKGSQYLRDYEYQMRVYSELYKQQTGEYPARAVLVFLGELNNDKLWEAAEGDPSNFSKIFFVVDPKPSHIQTAMSDFNGTVDRIEEERAKYFVDQWKAPDHEVDGDTCQACEIRFNCERQK
ncbi:PD-(D/E)XK nuclease family protein [Shewanella sp. 10N.286.51.B8]|uniref:PD-(D/E)XK nuclease family protein n=1 Tax=Shewanella sp. 10N.286.51.B8 TaxID=3229708 RepID=UPI003550BD3B